ncbi:MAG: hypothetical protein CSA24_00110 [Deltaproteobacteria bacterium]|nr:MAG: hypothetical protein CSA24_00110 [Deltaproteobacteria bacterium]
MIGTFELKEYHTKEHTLLALWPVVRLEDGTAVLIESLWDKSKRRDEATIKAYTGKRVAVTGMLHGEPPGAIANISEPCVSPVKSLDLLGE